jgi:hypothetical protein
LRRAAWERGGPLPSIDVADALLDERRKLLAGRGLVRATAASDKGTDCGHEINDPLQYRIPLCYNEIVLFKLGGRNRAAASGGKSSESG